MTYFKNFTVCYKLLAFQFIKLNTEIKLNYAGYTDELDDLIDLIFHHYLTKNS